MGAATGAGAFGLVRANPNLEWGLMRTVRPSRGWAVVAAAALGVAVVGVTALDGAREPDPTMSAPAAEPTVLGDEALLLDRGPVPDELALETCSSPRFAGQGAVEVLYGVHQVTVESEGPVVVLRNADGELLLCADGHPSGPSQFPAPAPSEDEPVVTLAGRAAWECTGRRLDRYTTTSWLGVDDGVVTVRQRVWVDAEPGPWFTTTAVNGFAHLSAWQDGPLPKGTELAVQFEVLDAGGGGVEQTALPTEPSDIGGCENGDVAVL